MQKIIKKKLQENMNIFLCLGEAEIEFVYNKELDIALFLCVWKSTDKEF